MNTITKIGAVILSLLRLKKEVSLDTILKPMSAIVDKLNDYAENQHKCSCESEKRIAELTAQAKQEAESAAQARKLAEKYSALTS